MLHGRLWTGPHTQSSLHTLVEVSSNHVQSRGRSRPGHSLQPEGCFGDWASLFLFFSSCPGSPRVPQVLQQALHYYALWYRGFNLYTSVHLFYSSFLKVQFIGKYPNILANISLHINIRVIINRYPTVFHTGWCSRWGVPCSLYIVPLCSQSVNCIYYFNQILLSALNRNACSAPQIDTYPDIPASF